MATLTLPKIGQARIHARLALELCDRARRQAETVAATSSSTATVNALVANLAALDVELLILADAVGLDVTPGRAEELAARLRREP